VRDDGRGEGGRDEAEVERGVEVGAAAAREEDAKARTTLARWGETIIREVIVSAIKAGAARARRAREAREGPASTAMRNGC
jgi:hypothetical protein